MKRTFVCTWLVHVLLMGVTTDPHVRLFHCCVHLPNATDLLVRTFPARFSSFLSCSLVFFSLDGVLREQA